MYLIALTAVIAIWGDKLKSQGIPAILGHINSINEYLYSAANYSMSTKAN